MKSTKLYKMFISIKVLKQVINKAWHLRLIYLFGYRKINSPKDEQTPKYYYHWSPYLLYERAGRKLRARRTHTRVARGHVWVRVGTGSADACADCDMPVLC